MLFYGYCSAYASAEVIRICCNVINLTQFINCSGDTEIFVSYEDDHQFAIKKQDVTWTYIEYIKGRY